MNIKQQIGQRIQEERKAKGMTQAVLAELAGNLTQPRVNNWERGIRTPGLEEVKQIAKVLDVSPAYLMGLTSRKTQHPLEQPHIGALVPLLNHQQARDPQHWITAIKDEEYDEKITFIPITLELAKIAGSALFAIEVKDKSMEPELLIKDIIIVSPALAPQPGNLVVAKIENSDEIIIRRLKLLSANIDGDFELLAINEHWPNIKKDKVTRCSILGTVIFLTRQLTVFDNQR